MTSTPKRYAIYFTPPVDDPLSLTAARWLGRNPFTGATFPPDDADQAHHTASARRYGFHGTLKAPFRLADGQSQAELVEAVNTFCAAKAPFILPSIIVSQIGPFFALVPVARDRRLDDLAACIVEGFDPFRAPLTDAEVARRRPETLNSAQMAHLNKWGYPHVMDHFRFHMTLTGPVHGDDVARMSTVLRKRFAAFHERALHIDSLSLFIEDAPGAPFRVLHTCALEKT